MKRFFLIIPFVPVRLSAAQQVPLFFLFLLLLMPMGYVSAKPQSVKTSEAVIDAEAQKRKLNRERLMA